MTTIAKKDESKLSNEELQKIDAYWRAANYLAVGQIYLLDNPLLREPLKNEHIKPRLLGHWGTDPGLSFVYVHLNRLIKKYDLNMLFVTGPGHGAPAIIANTYLEGTYSEVYPTISQDAAGIKKAVQAIFFSRGHSKSYSSRDSGLHQRRWRAWLFSNSRLRCRF